MEINKLTEIRSVLIAEESRLSNITLATERLNIIFNILHLKHQIGDTNNIYIYIKEFIDSYIEVVKNSQFGYDFFNLEKIESLLMLLPIEQQLSILQFILSALTRELPDHDKSWFLKKKEKLEIEVLYKNFNFKNLFRLLALLAGFNIFSLIGIILSIILIVSLFLLPAYSDFFAIFEVNYESYADNFLLNHFLNICSFFVDLDNDFKIKPLNSFATIICLIAKFFYLLLIANYFYNKITEKITFS